MSYNHNIISIEFPRTQAKLFRSLKKDGYFPSLGSIVRYCINYSIPRLLSEIRALNNYIENNNHYHIIKTLQKFGYIIHKGSQATKKIPMLSINHDGVNTPVQ